MHAKEIIYEKGVGVNVPDEQKNIHTGNLIRGMGLIVPLLSIIGSLKEQEDPI